MRDASGRWRSAHVLRECDVTDAKSMYEVVKPKTTYVIRDDAFVEANSDCDGGGLTSIPTV